METKDFNYKGHRNSYTELNAVYFWTITVTHWYHLLNAEANKMIIINSLQWLCNNQLVQVYGYVVMPNHIHLMWNQLKMNGKEFPKNSFEKYTSKLLLKNMRLQRNEEINKYAVAESDRQYNIWQRDPLAIPILDREMAVQKLNYIHNNPLQPRWTLSDAAEHYRFSSASFYLNGIDEFNIVTHYMDVL